MKYFIRYFDLVGIEHKLDIYDDTYVDTPIQIDGRIHLTYSETDDSLESIRGQGLKVGLEADEDLTFGDLWTEDEKTLKVIYTRGFIILFQGWLNPEGFFEDYVNTNWVVSFDCVDGLGYLKDLSFVNSNGFPITGMKTYLEILSLALRRTGLDLNINTDIQIRYTGLSDALDVLDNTYVLTERYTKDDNDTIMDCEEVIRDVLEPFGAVLTSFNGEWYIYKPNQLYINSEATFYSYTYLGIIDPVTPSKTLDFSLNIGSEINGFAIHHCNANQSIRNTSSIGAYRINYKYGLVQSFFSNTSLLSEDGVTIRDWFIIDDTYLDPLVAGVSGINIETLENEPPGVLRTNAILTDASIPININVNYSIIRTTGTRNSIEFIYSVILSDKLITDPTANKYYLKNDLSWGDENEFAILGNFSLNKDVTLNITTPQFTAIQGNMYLYFFIHTPLEFELPALSKVHVINVTLRPADDSQLPLDGEFHTFQRTTKPSAKVKEVTKVATGDNDTDLYEGTIYKNDKSTPTITWERKTFTEEKPLLRIMGEETMRMNQLPSRVFTGDIYGFFNYLSVVVIDGLDGLFMLIKYSYDTKNNIISSEFRQIYADELGDIDYDFQLDYGKTVKPTIV